MPGTYVTANPAGWTDSQEYELRYWRDEWPYRHMPIADLQRLRHEDAAWFLGEMGFARPFSDFTGDVLEVGCGPIGFFELMNGVRVVAQDSLMAAYARALTFSKLGARGAAIYLARDIDQIDGTFDFVVCSNVLDHTADWIEFLQHCRNRLNPGGQLLLFTDSRGAPAPGHTQIFSPQQLVRVVNLLGAKHLIVSRAQAVNDGHRDYTNTIRAAF